MELFISLGGILCIYLGYRIFIIGTNQPFQIFADLTGRKLMAAIISPAIFLSILGSLIICSPVITNIISIFQNQKFINSYATKLILEELQKKNKIISSQRFNDKEKTAEHTNKGYPEKLNFVSRTLEEPDRAIVTCNVLRIRKHPGTHYQVIGSLRKGHIIIVKEKRGLWLRVSTGDYADGWVHSHYVKRPESLRTKDQPKSPLLLRTTIFHQ
jgi:uncharacterized protein YgiM (DUF1202 family)